MYDPNRAEDVVWISPNAPSLLIEYSVPDATWPSRRWRADRSDYIDLSGGEVAVCQACTERRRRSPDVNVDGHVLCAIRGCGNDAAENVKYCDPHYLEIYPDAPKGEE